MAYKVPELFGSLVFNDEVMRERLPKDVYKSLHKTIEAGKDLDITVANSVAAAMKDWALEQGATHYTHWFQPMTGITAEKHDSFIAPTSDGRVIMEFSGKELIKGEPDASSFPSGGLRATFEARGYTAWDPTSYAFIKDGSLCIPCIFCSYGGEILDKKTPLLRSMEAVGEQALRVVKLFGGDGVRRVMTTVGPEQEYFLVDRALWAKRPDLFFCGRTLIGAKPPKGQELSDHYFGAIKPRIAAYMKELDEELWKLGILSKTKHNEAAPAQHEMAPIFTTTNLAVDQNQLTMEVMKNVAQRHGMVCLLHEKPFKGVSGSGKHNNWSLSTDTGVNLLDPGKTPYENAQFLLFLTAVIKAVDEHQDLLRISVASAGNDHRIGEHEAPPAIVSMFVGDELGAILDALEAGTDYLGTARVKMDIGVHVLPTISKDTTDRNRTSPFAFTGNKFEFRMLGSSLSTAETNIVLNTIIAETLREFADELEGAEDFGAALNDLIRRTVKAHKRIIFNGDCYAEAWQDEAARRGLCNYRTTPDALPHFVDGKNIDLFTRHRVFTETEMYARLAILLENYAKTINIEARTMAEMVKKDILPAVSSFAAKLAETITAKRTVVPGMTCAYEADLLTRISALTDRAYAGLTGLENALADVPAHSGTALEVAIYYRDRILTAMAVLRESVDELETLTAGDAWPYPTYGDLMFRI